MLATSENVWKTRKAGAEAVLGLGLQCVAAVTRDGTLGALRGSFALVCGKQKTIRGSIYCSDFHLHFFLSWPPHTQETYDQHPTAKNLSYV